MDFFKKGLFFTFPHFFPHRLKKVQFILPKGLAKSLTLFLCPKSALFMTSAEAVRAARGHKMKSSIQSVVSDAPQAGSWPAGSMLLAIVPGISGGVALMVNEVPDGQPLPPSTGEVRSLLRAIQAAAAASGYQPVCALRRATGSAAGQYAFIRGQVQSLGMQLVPVRSWGATHASASLAPVLRQKLLTEAQRQFPHLTVTPATAEALLLLAWLRAGGGLKVRAAQDDGQKSAVGGQRAEGHRATNGKSET